MLLNGEIPKLQLSSIVDELVLGLTIAMDVDEGEKLYHCWRVAVIADAMAEKLPQVDRAVTFFTGLLHDIGGIGSPIHLVEYSRKKETPSGQIPEALHHPYLGAQFVRNIPGLRARYRIADLVLQHHEKWDGGGFPSGLAGDEIALEAMLVAAADSADVMRVADATAAALPEIFTAIRKNGRVKPSLVHLLQTVIEGDLLHIIKDEQRLGAHVESLYQRHREELFAEIEEELLLEGMFMMAGKAIDNKHSYTHGHSARVGFYAVQIGLQMGLREEDVLNLYYGAFVHDIGKLGVARRILDAPGRLEQEDWHTMKGHARLSWDIMQLFPSLKPFSFAALHHERWDGKGYPFGMKGEEIPLLGRIMCVADSLDAMTSARSYRRIWTFRRALQEIKDHAGQQFAPQVAEAAREAFADGSQHDLADTQILLAQKSWRMRGIIGDAG